MLESHLNPVIKRILSHCAWDERLELTSTNLTTRKINPSMRYQLEGDMVITIAFNICAYIFLQKYFDKLLLMSRLIFLSVFSLGCQKAVDIAIVIDTSGSVNQVNFNKVIQFLKLFVDRFDFPDSGTRYHSIKI